MANRDIPTELLSDFVYYGKYAKYLDNLQRRESWEEAWDRVYNMHAKKYDFDNRTDEIPLLTRVAISKGKQKKLLGSQRVLQFAGEPIFQREMRAYNCLARETPFITTEGTKTFEDYQDGDQVTVLTHTGKFKSAMVKNFGIQRLRKIKIKRGRAEHEVWATDNHNWILDNGARTSDLKTGDKLMYGPDTSNFDYDAASVEERLYWCYGYVFGDGTLIKNKISGKYVTSKVRLCGSDVQYKYRFEEMGFTTSTGLSLNGDFIAYTGGYLKTVPDPKIDSPELIRAWVHGYLAADGSKNLNMGRSSHNMYRSIQATGDISINAIRQLFPLAGFYIISELDLTGQITNYGTRPHTIRFAISNSLSNTSAKFVATLTEEFREEEVWCLVVDDDHSFIMPFGLVTGNCQYSYCDRPRFFAEILFLLLCGSGCGFSVQSHHVAKLPKLVDMDTWHLRRKKEIFVEDSIEGWADAVNCLINAYLPTNAEDSSFEPEFNYVLVRKKGSKLSSGGKAPGYKPLETALERVRAILVKAVANRDLKDSLSTIECYDIVLHLSDAVLSGGVRRSACIALFDIDDEDMLNSKTGNWFVENPQRARANNSVVCIQDEVTYEDFENVIKRTKEFGDPGFVFVKSREHGTNPCGEVSLIPVLITDPDGNVCKEYTLDMLDNQDKYKAFGYTYESGWQSCNLCTIDMSKVATTTEFYFLCEYATVLGTLQAGYTNAGYLGITSQKIIERESLLGISMTGIMENPAIALNPQILRGGAAIVVNTNKEISSLLGIPQAARTTTVKPEGTGSLVLGTSSGIHAHHHKRFLRRVQNSLLDPVYQYFKEKNPKLCEKSVWNTNTEEEVITFPVSVPPESVVKGELTAEKFLENVRIVQENWVLPGTALPMSVEGATHNVSNTCEVKDSEWEKVTKILFDNRHIYSGVSLLGSFGDYDVPQAPLQRVYCTNEIKEMCTEEEYSIALDIYTNPNKDNLEVSKEIKKIVGYIAVYEHWKYLRANLRSVDYSRMMETDDNTKQAETLACGSGGCELV